MPCALGVHFPLKIPKGCPHKLQYYRLISFFPQSGGNQAVCTYPLNSTNSLLQVLCRLQGGFVGKNEKSVQMLAFYARFTLVCLPCVVEGTLGAKIWKPKCTTTISQFSHRISAYWPFSGSSRGGGGWLTAS